MVVRDRLAELQENAKHIKPSDLEEGETTPLKQKDKKMSASQIDFLEALQELHEDIEQVNIIFTEDISKCLKNTDQKTRENKYINFTKKMYFDDFFGLDFLKRFWPIISIFLLKSALFSYTG